MKLSKTAKPERTITAGWTGRTNGLATNETSETRPNCQAITGRVVNWAARVKNMAELIGAEMLWAVPIGRRRASSRVNQSWRGWAYRISPSVAAKESWKP